MDNEKEDIKLGCWQMRGFLKHFIIHIVLLGLGGSYIIALVMGKENYIDAFNFLVFILTIVASVLSVVSLILSYQSSRQAQEMQREFTEKLTLIVERLPNNFQKTEKDWKKNEG